jgi:hypothetical protein
MKRPITPRSSGKKLFEEGVTADTLRLVAGWINESQEKQDLPDDDRLTAFYGELLMAAKRIDAHARKMAAITDALDCEEDP